MPSEHDLIEVKLGTSFASLSDAGGSAQSVHGRNETTCIMNALVHGIRGAPTGG
jgi:hypothetical protein